MLSTLAFFFHSNLSFISLFLYFWKLDLLWSGFSFIMTCLALGKLLNLTCFFIRKAGIMILPHWVDMRLNWDNACEMLECWHEQMLYRLYTHISKILLLCIISLLLSCSGISFFSLFCFTSLFSPLPFFSLYFIFFLTGYGIQQICQNIGYICIVLGFPILI